jgi:D-aminoacyl-tRNA deacylase
MNLSVVDVAGEVLLVSNFTLAGDCRKGNRPSFDGAMKTPRAAEEFELLVREVGANLGEHGAASVKTGVFGADMLVAISNDGPVTLIVDSRTRPGV